MYSEQSESRAFERRGVTRHNVELEIQITAVDGVSVNRNGRTRNISAGGGVCFSSEEALISKSKVEYVLTLSGNNPPVKILCVGRVVRCVARPAEEGEQFEIAVTMARYRFVNPASQTQTPDQSHKQTGDRGKAVHRAA